MGIFDGIENVSAEGISAPRQYFEPGNYIVTINRIIIHEKRLGRTKLFIVETTINESDNPDIKVGEQRNWVQSLGSDYALPRIKTFIGAALGLCPQKQTKEINQKVTSSICDHAIEPTSPILGRQLKLRCWNQVANNGNDFTRHSWGVIE